jgi:hypothetical protein
MLTHASFPLLTRRITLCQKLPWLTFKPGHLPLIRVAVAPFATPATGRRASPNTSSCMSEEAVERLPPPVSGARPARNVCARRSVEGMYLQRVRQLFQKSSENKDRGMRCQKWLCDSLAVTVKYKYRVTA